MLAESIRAKVGCLWGRPLSDHGTLVGTLVGLGSGKCLCCAVVVVVASVSRLVRVGPPPSFVGVLDLHSLCLWNYQYTQDLWESIVSGFLHVSSHPSDLTKYPQSGDGLIG